MRLLTQALSPSLHLPQPSKQPQTLRSDNPSGHGHLIQPPEAVSLKHIHKRSRRELAIGVSSLPMLPTYFQSNRARAADENISNTNNETTAQEIDTKETNCVSKPTTKQAFFDVSINGEPAGRVIVGLYGENVPISVARFGSLVSGTAGISYRRKEFVKIMPNYIQHAGLRSFGVDSELAKKTGTNLIADELLSEWDMENKNCPGIKNVAGSLGIIIRDPLKPPPKLKLVARKGKLEIDEEEVGTDPNGTEFVIATKDSPELDASTLVVGRVLDGMDIVEKISKVKTVQENTSSPYFRAAKLIGDKRAVVAERGFNRPYSKVIITNCGLLK